VFGCDSYLHAPNENRSTLDNKIENCIFICYKYGMRGYNIWNPETKKIVYSWDVVFREVKDVPKHEFLPRKEENEKIKFELDDEKSESTEEDE
jgi:hypothetical protein